MDGCADVGCVLSYNGSVLDAVLNYAMLVVAVGAGVLLLRGQRPADGPRARARAVWQGCALLGVCAFQLGLCLALGCSGVSIVWNAVVGFMLYQLAPSRLLLAAAPASDSGTAPAVVPVGIGASAPLGAAVLAGGLDAYYAATAEPITTYAHLCALLLGVVLSAADVMCCFPRRHDDDASLLVRSGSRARSLSR